jgi:hypothetical protein
VIRRGPAAVQIYQSGSFQWLNRFLTVMSFVVMISPDASGGGPLSETRVSTTPKTSVPFSLKDGVPKSARDQSVKSLPE